MEPLQPGLTADEAAACLRPVLDHFREGFVVKDAEGRYLYANAAAARMLGRLVQEVVGRRDEDLLDATTAASLRAGDQAARLQSRPLYRDERLPGGDEGVIELQTLRYCAPGAADPAAAPVCALWTDVTQVRRLQAQLRHALEQLELQQRQNEELRQELQDQPVRDPVSGVYNRHHFEEQLRREIDLSLRENREFALVAIRIDRYGELLERLGAAAGERVLQALGRLLRGNTRVMDAPCRLGEERFAVLLSGVGLATAHARMESVRRQCEAQMVLLEGSELRFTVSMGVASFPHTAQDRQALLAAAEAALARAGERGGNCTLPAPIALDPR
ncbi:putative diguanylate cyclase AdrA [Tepidimonas fonticaldi]|uniref:diguanylate cyclase n=2 Tax=Burkholderiales TaxID=80840 RepID=A0A554XG98_9BURK|nr:sensor domain-containing diguanylate cyclase [Tepidimonas fonticaldi]TSE34842.1 putative diguanylate cyclase AdrA [Tepidimonas fonticaldi]